MRPAEKIRVRFAAVAFVVAVGFVWFALELLTPSCGRLIGYADQQPVLQITVLDSNTRPEAPPYIAEVAKLHLTEFAGLATLYWPEPSAVIERPSCWLVEFKRRVPRYRLMGYTVTVKPTDPVMFMSISKMDLSMRWGNWCQ